MQWLTDFGDQAVVLPTGLAILLVLLLCRWWRGAVCWSLGLGGVLGVMLVLKLVVGACGWELGVPALNSPSGHTASAAFLYGGLASLLFPALGLAGCGIACLSIAVVFAVSRLLLHDHTLIEVVLGGVVGLSGLLLFRLARGPIPARLDRRVLLGLVLAVALICHGTRLQAERRLHSFATEQLRAMVCPMPRGSFSQARLNARAGGDAAPG